ncbi:class I SAM-dependent methyltransferase [Bacillus canaveralius]|uniref:class I SAM-dependent methyltransferase n=1 Tax=Bacillus canaveralius TaxID=1403243 RepID=UPI000F7A3D56|nr:class I SAM-dependent methyltransferase [Bacillus canaveralius]RSK43894.1 class I SAM-dependent methyltransferase [Bacillus canaveralius]
MGKEFLELFEQWADSYDSSVSGHDIEYKEVFKNYEKILGEVAARSNGHVLEFGVGTGNLTESLLAKGLKVTGIEPSPAMRKIAEEKLAGRVAVLGGDFLSFPEVEPFQTVVSTYAFHHLTDEEKAEAIARYGNLLAPGGKIVFADTMYESAEAYKEAITDAVSKSFHNLAEDLQREYYTTIPILTEILETNGFTAAFEKCNDFVWIMEGEKR